MIYLKIDVRDSYCYPVKNGDNLIRKRLIELASELEPCVARSSIA